MTLSQQITEDMIDYYKVFTDIGEDGLKIRERDLLFPPRYKLKFNLIDSSIAPKNYKITIEFIDTEPPAETTVFLENPSKYNVIYILCNLYWVGSLN